MDEKGEDNPSVGKLQLYNIQGGKFMKFFESSQFRGGITMIYSIDGILIVAEGNKINLYQYIPIANEIKKLSVIDNKNLVVCSKILKRFIVAGDIFNSLTLIVFKHEGSYDVANSSIYIMGKDNNNYRTSAIDFWRDDTEESNKIGFILADDQNNIHLFDIDTEPSSVNTNLLSECADIHLSKKITEFRYYSINNKSMNYYSGSDGSFGLLRLVPKESYKHLSLLCEFMYNHLPFRGGLNPKAFFTVKYRNKSEKGNILDYDILNLFLSMPISTQTIVAKHLVLTRELVIQNINQIKNI